MSPNISHRILLHTRSQGKRNSLMHTKAYLIPLLSFTKFLNSVSLFPSSSLPRPLFLSHISLCFTSDSLPLKHVYVNTITRLVISLFITFIYTLAYRCVFLVLVNCILHDGEWSPWIHREDIVWKRVMLMNVVIKVSRSNRQLKQYKWNADYNIEKHMATWVMPILLRENNSLICL